MRVLSVQQPFAQLIVRGVKRVEVRGWTTDYRGRIAIHASSAVPSQEIEQIWRTDRAMALRFADEGWLDREDLKALPRSAIIGTVLLSGIARGRDQDTDREDASGVLAFNPVTNLFELAKRSKRTGRLVPRHTTLTPLPVAFKPDDFIWAFTDTVEIEPLDGVDGQQRLWNLEPELAHQVGQREAVALSGEWEPRAVSAKRRSESIRVWRDRWLTDLERDVIRIEERVAREREDSRLVFERHLEDRFLEIWIDYLARHGVSVADPNAPVPLEGRLRSLFHGRDAVPAAELEREVRRYVQTEAKRQAAEGRAKRRRKLMMQRLHELRQDPSSLAGKVWDDKPLTPEVQVVRELTAMLAREEDGEEPPDNSAKQERPGQ